MKKRIFSEAEIPYKTLERFGLSRQMVEDLPQQALDNICSGYRSPLLPITFKTEGGAMVKSQSRFRLVYDQDNAVQVLFAPKLMATDLSRFHPDNQEVLRQGDAVFVGGAEPKFYQIDPATGQVLSVPSPVIGNNLQILLEKFHLTSPELSCLRNGEPLTIYVDDKPVTMGVDLNSECGVRVANGDEEEWRRDSKREWDKYSFGTNGCWVTDDDGAMSYVAEDDYTDELWNEMKKKGQAVAQSAGPRR